MMKKLYPILIISLLFISLGFSQKEYDGNDLIKMDNGLWTVKFSDEPISGKVYGGFGEDGNLKKVYVGNVLNGKKEGKWVSYFHSTGRKEYDENYKDGKKHGLYTRWYENGNKKGEGTYKDGKTDGLWTRWYENGQKEIEGTYKNGKEDGLWTDWYDNGQKRYEGTYDLSWEEDGLWTQWYENGQKQFETTYKNGKEDGLWTLWYPNGQKESETTFKDGEFISYKYWNEDGSVKQ